MGRIVTRTVWTPDMDARLTKMLAEGVTSTRIGQIMGFSRSAIMGRATRMGMPFKNNRPNGKAWTPALDAQVAKLVAQGLTLTEVGEEIGRSRDSIKARINKLAMPVPIKHANQHSNSKSNKVLLESSTRRILTTEERQQLIAEIGAGENLRMEELNEYSCRYPVSDTTPFTFCGHPRKQGWYCKDHWQITHPNAPLSRL